MKQLNRVQHTVDEFDVTALFQNARLFFSHYGKLLLIVALAGLLAGGLRFWLTPNLYSSSLMLQPTILSDPEQMELINNWSAMLKKKELRVLAKQFNINEAVLHKVQSITTEELEKSYSPGNYTAFTLTAIVTDTAVLRPLQKGIEYALDNSEYVKDKLIIKRNNLHALIQTLQQEITRLNNLQTAVATSLLQNNNNSGRFILNVSDVSSQIAGLQEKKLNFEENLSFTSAVHVLQNFYMPSRPTFPVLIKQLLMGLAGGLFLGNAIAFYLYIQRKAAKT